MTHHRNQQKVVIANVSRRNLLKGVAGTGVFVLAAQFPAVRSAMAYATGAEKMPHGVVTNPHILLQSTRTELSPSWLTVPKWVMARHAHRCR